jgi:hypothetical protein
MIQFILQHQFWAAVGIYWIFSAAVSSMPEPGAGDSPVYLWLYRFLHTTAGNITTVLGNRIPGLKLLVPLLLVPLVFSTAACASHYTIHPGALNVTDSAAYDTLLVAQAAIEQARVENQTRTLPAGEKDALNTLIRSYNIARESWLTYRSAITTKVPSDEYFQQLSQNLTDLAEAIQALKGKEVEK